MQGSRVRLSIWAFFGYLLIVIVIVSRQFLFAKARDKNPDSDGLSDSEMAP